MTPFEPTIRPEIFALRPDFTVLCILVRDCQNGASGPLANISPSDLSHAVWAEMHLNSWREAYRAFGANPKKTPSSAEALRKRARKDGGLPQINAVVDLYNVLSVRYAIPIGGEDADCYLGQPELRRAEGTEIFDTMIDGRLGRQTADPGEVIWCDEAGATCRRWNWRQGIRTRITETSRNMWFVFERLDSMPMDALREAGKALIDGLQSVTPGLRFTVQECCAQDRTCTAG